VRLPEDAGPTGLKISIGLAIYNDAAPLALEGAPSRLGIGGVM